MAYRQDEDLEFLSSLSSEELDPIVKLLIYDKDNKKRYTEEITSDRLYQQYTPDHAKYWQLIAEEIQKFGGNTLVNIARGKGILYKEILCDACDKSKVNYNKKASTEMIESNLLQKILTDAIEKMDTSDLEKVASELNLKTTNMTPQAVIGALQLALRNTVYIWGDVAYIIFHSVIAQLLTRTGIVVTTNIMGSRLLALFAGPIGLAITGIWTAVDIAGPAYRVTIPITIMIACLRQMHKNQTSRTDEKQ